MLDVITLQKNVPYTRTEIQKMFGGEIQSYLPQKNKRIVAGCFTRVQMNPDAPLIIQAGNLPKVIAKADLLGQDATQYIPVFLKERIADRYYYFEGYFRCVAVSEKRDDIENAEARSGRHGEIARVITLARV